MPFKITQAALSNLVNFDPYTEKLNPDLSIIKRSGFEKLLYLLGQCFNCFRKYTAPMFDSEETIVKLTTFIERKIRDNTFENVAADEPKALAKLIQTATLLNEETFYADHYDNLSVQIKLLNNIGQKPW